MKKDELKKFLVQETENVNISMSNELLNTPIQNKGSAKVDNRENVSRKFLPLLTSITCCLLIICLCFAFIPLNNQTQLTSYILKINPEFCITTDQNDNVVNICSLNADADNVLDKEVFNNIVGVKFSNCISLIINNIDENIFQNYGSNRIALYALNDDREVTNEKLDVFGDIVRQSLDNLGYPNIQFDKNEISIEDFKNKMGFNNDFNYLNDMRQLIEQHNRFFDQNHFLPPR